MFGFGFDRLLDLHLTFANFTVTKTKTIFKRNSDKSYSLRKKESKKPLSQKMSESKGDTINLVIKWAGKEYPLDDLPLSSTVQDLKNVIQTKTNVLPVRQKLLNLRYKGKAPSDDQHLSSLSLKNGTKIMMMGSVEQTIQEANEVPTDLPTIIDDFDDATEQKLSIEYREEYLAKVANRVQNYEVKILNELREGKKLLVLDIDYTLFDHRTPAEKGEELMRPHLHEFLSTAYKVSHLFTNISLKYENHF